MSNRAVLGTFDGVHRAHGALFARAAELSQKDGMPVVALVIYREGRAITPIELREEYLRGCADLEAVHVIPLEEVRHMSAESFARYIKEEFRVEAAVCGDDFRFGRDRQGDAQTLGRYFPTEVMPEMRIDGERVSSTRIRTALTEGRIEEANGLMGRPYSVCGRVAHGKSLGSTRGYPTANIPFPSDKAPVKRGVYFTRVHTDGGVYNAVSNVGVCPTVDGEDTVVESFLFGFSGSLYGGTVTVDFLYFHREEVRFPDVDALYRQIAADKEAAEKFFS